ncbi:trimeric intracellular cation channel family protein [Nocardioides sp. SYSU DS0663]|uniref:trimeric intracellular cation channel family protein n=1 Tax=Nocardioides sp. SYSU DS0663 TaxID=3416445 RepID=UPI003F4AFB4C
MPLAIPLAVELAAVALGALQGALFAGAFTDRHIDVLGAVMVGVGLALGGSVLRDLLLGEAPVVIRGEWYVLVAVVAALVGMSLQQLFARLTPVILPLDAVTIGLFGAIGTSKALDLQVPAIPAVLVGTVSAVGGSVIRDLMLNLPVAFLHVGSLYAVAAAAGAALLVLLIAAGAAILDAVIAGVALTTATRLLAVRFGWSFPEQRALVVRRRRSRGPA